MKRFIEEADRTQLTLLPESLDDYIGESNPVRAIEAFVAHLDLADLGFEVVPEATGRPGYHPSVLLRLYIYGYLNRISSSRCLEREAARNLEVIWLLGRLAPDDKVIADFRKDNGAAIKKVCVRFVELCRQMGLLMCRFLGRRDVGPSPRAHGRRRRSAKARSRGNWGRRVQRALWRFDRSAGVDCGLAIATDVHANTISARWTVGERLCEPPLGGFATPIGCFRPSRIVAGAGPADRRGQVASG
jgi:transposase